MMPVEFPEQNCLLGKPKTMTDEECSALACFTDGKQCVSCWQFNKEDLEEIQRTGKIWLIVVSGHSQPPVTLQTESPFIPA